MVIIRSFFHRKSHVKTCLHCNKTHGINSQSTCKRYVKNEKVHYTTKTCAQEFELQGKNNIYKHDAFFYTWCYDDSLFQKWMYTIKKEHSIVYMGYLFTRDECKYTIPRILQKYTEVNILKLHNEIELKSDKVICELDIGNISNDDNNEDNNV